MRVRAAHVLATMALLALFLSVIPGEAATDTLHAGTAIPADYRLPSDLVLAVYVPSGLHKQRAYIPMMSIWFEPGKAIEIGIASTLQQYFPSGFVLTSDDTRPYGLLLVLHPKWSGDNNVLTTTLSYRVIDAQGKQVDQGEQAATAKRKDLSGNAERQASAKAMQQVIAAVITHLHPTAASHAATAHVADVDPVLLVNYDKPYATGTGFFINTGGQIMTAAHVVADCQMLEAHRDTTVLRAKTRVQSNLLDVAVLDSGRPAEHFLPWRQDTSLDVGEPVVNVGYPLQTILAASPNLTRGNVSSRGGLSGSMGQFQFSAPIQPGSSGGPVVSDGGELLGITVGTLNATLLIDKGLLPQNVNFALEARYAAMFLRRNNIGFVEVPPRRDGDARTGNGSALAATVQLSCYQ